MDGFAVVQISKKESVQFQKTQRKKLVQMNEQTNENISSDNLVETEKMGNRKKNLFKEEKNTRCLHNKTRILYNVHF